MFQSLEPLKNIALAKDMYYEQWINSKDITLTCFEWDQTLLYMHWELRSSFQGTKWNQILKGHLNFDCCLTGTFSTIAQNC